jgi:ribosomal protein S18 acetylase RimI-like enzyme
MICLRKMKLEELNGYLDLLVPDYIDEVVHNFHFSREKAQEYVINEINNFLPQGVETRGEFLFCIEVNNAVVGFLWYRLIYDGKIIFINDIFVLPQFRGRGYGKATLAELESRAAAQSVEHIELRVAYDNERALGLYKKTGFLETGINMIKPVSR